MENVDFKFQWDFEKNIFEETQITSETIVLDSPENNDFQMDLEYFDEDKQEDKLWMARTGLNHDTLCGAVETIIFMSDKPVPLLKIKNQIDEDLPLRVIHDAITKLQNDYELKHHGIRLQEVAEGYQFRTKATYSKFVQSLFKVNAIVLSPSSLEVLAMIAYKQPVSKTDIEKIRGVDSSHLIRGLMDKRLVKVIGRSDELGRPTTYGTTDDFLEIFNLNDLSNLPPEYELDDVASGRAFGKIQDIKSIVTLGDKKKFDFDEIEELDQLTQSIKDISADTLFTRSLNDENKKRLEGEVEEKKSAFDILEEFVNQNQTLKQNQMAAESNTPMQFMEARIVDLLKEEGLINAPKVDDDYMVELDEKLEDLAEKSNEVMEAHGLDIDQDKFEELTSEEEIPAMTLEEEAQKLEAELDLAFDQLMGQKQDRIADEDELEVEESHENDDLTDMIDSMVSKAREMDIDLEFLKKTSNSEELPEDQNDQE